MKPDATSTIEHHSHWQWWLGAIAAAAAFLFGAFGMWRYENAAGPGAHADALSVIYHTLQLFILHAPHLERAVPWQLHVGRLLAAGVFITAARKAFGKVFRDELQMLRHWMPWRRGHVVVCGLGDLGLRLALDGRRRRRFVVAIEKDPSPVALERARASGVLVLEGDARDPAQLRHARVDRAKILFAACNDDQTNVAIAAIAGRFAQRDKRRAAPLVCRLLTRDPKLRPLVSDETLFPRTGPSYRVNFNDLDLEGTAARQALRRCPLDFEPIHEDTDLLVHLVVIGFGQIGQSMALHAARIGHYANEVGRLRKRLRITAVDKDAIGWDAFVAKYRNLPFVCDADFTLHDPVSASLVEAMAKLCPQADARTELLTYAICLEGDDHTNLRVGLELSKLIANRSAQVLIHQTSRQGFAELFPPEGRGPGLGSRVHVFGMEEDVFGWDVLLHESEDKLARAIHEDYRAKEAARKVPDKDNPGWDDLTEGLKESNRQAADHMPAKLRAIGYYDAPLSGEKHRIEYFENKELLLLAKMEHARWCAERWLDGWTRGPARDRERKISDCLCPWYELSREKQENDIEQIRLIPKLLFMIQRGIYR